MKAANYLRVSTDSQREKHTIETQRDSNTRYAGAFDIVVHKEYVDDGVSGSVPIHLRPGGSELLRDAKARKFDRLIIFKLDRLGRTAAEILHVVNQLDRLDIKLVSVTERIDSDTPMGRAMLGMLAVFAELEKNNIRERTMTGSYRVAREGKNVAGRPAFGYKVEGGYWVIDEEAAETVRRIYKEYLTGLSCFGVAKKMSRLCPSPKGGDWKATTVLNILRNETYAGRAAYGKRQMYTTDDGKSRYKIRPRSERIYIEVPAIVTRETWEAVQRQRTQNGKLSNRNSTREYALRSKVKCGLCGYSYTGHTSRWDGRSYVYYNCGSVTAMSLRKACGNPSIRAEVLEAKIWEDITGFIKNPRSVLDTVMSKLDAARGRSDAAAELARVRRRLGEAAEARGNLVRAVAKGILTDEEAAEEMSRVRAAVAALENEKMNLEDRSRAEAEREGTLRDVDSVLAALADRVDSADEKTKVSIIRRLVDKVVIHPPGGGVDRSHAEIHYLFSCAQNGRPL